MLLTTWLDCGKRVIVYKYIGVIYEKAATSNDLAQLMRLPHIPTSWKAMWAWSTLAEHVASGQQYRHGGNVGLNYVDMSQDFETVGARL